MHALKMAPRLWGSVFVGCFAGEGLVHDSTSDPAAAGTAQGTAAITFSKVIHKANAKEFTSWLQTVYPTVGTTHPTTALLLAKARRFVRRFHREHAGMALEMGLTDDDISILHVYTLECEIYRRVCTPVLAFFLVCRQCLVPLPFCSGCSAPHCHA